MIFKDYFERLPFEYDLELQDDDDDERNDNEKMEQRLKHLSYFLPFSCFQNSDKAVRGVLQVKCKWNEMRKLCSRIGGKYGNISSRQPTRPNKFSSAA